MVSCVIAVVDDVTCLGLSWWVNLFIVSFGKFMMSLL